jgi:hypothetical protein
VPKLRIYQQVVWEHQGQVIADPRGSLRTPYYEVEIESTKRPRTHVKTIPASTTGTQIYNFEWGESFELLRVSLVGSGYVMLSWQVDKPTVADPLLPTGEAICWFHKEMSCFAPEFFSTDQCLTHPDEAIAAGGTGGSLGGIQPRLATDGGAVNGRIFYIQAQNYGTEDVIVQVDIWG